jgi:hypothetical protein
MVMSIGSEAPAKGRPVRVSPDKPQFARCAERRLLSLGTHQSICGFSD